MKKVAVSYKGKHFVVQDEDTLDSYDEIDPYVDIEKVIASALESHVWDCLYYGIPAYIGKDKKLHKMIGRIERRIQKK